MRFRRKKERACNTARYALEKALRISRSHITQWTVMTSLVMRTSVLTNSLPRNHLHWVQTKIKISYSEYG